MKRVLMFLFLAVIVGCSKSNQSQQMSQVEWNRQYAEILIDLEKIEADARTMNPKAEELLAQVEFYRQELERPLPEGTKEEICQELDKLWE